MGLEMGPQRNRIVTLIGITASLSSLKSFGQLWSVSGKTKGSACTENWFTDGAEWSGASPAISRRVLGK